MEVIAEMEFTRRLSPKENQHGRAYIENVIHANEQAAIIKKEDYFKNLKVYFANYENSSVNEVFNVAFGDNTTLNQLFDYLKINLSKYDSEIKNVEPIYGPNRKGDIPHSLASIEKGKTVLNYHPQYDAKKGFELTAEWYYSGANKEKKKL